MGEVLEITMYTTMCEVKRKGLVQENDKRICILLDKKKIKKIKQVPKHYCTKRFFLVPFLKL